MMYKKTLIISNRVISTTDNNGKTLYSLFNNIPKESLGQLYFSNNLPEIEGYNYFQLSDIDILLGKLRKSRRGKKVTVERNSNFEMQRRIPLHLKVRKNDITILVRELLWKNSWKSKQLDLWLDDFKPECIFLMAGDSLFVYDICSYIATKYRCSLITYITDDYVLPRKKESIIAKHRREKVYEKLNECIQRSDAFFTISERMKKTYKKLFKTDSQIIFNNSELVNKELLYDESKFNHEIVLTYAGSLYYGRDRLLTKLAIEIERYNKSHKKAKAILFIYSNAQPDRSFIKSLSNTKSGFYKGALDNEELRKKLNSSNILVFVESFDEDQIEKTRLSFSTKIPEYMSAKKCILAIGPQNIGSMDALRNASLCIYNEDDIYRTLERILDSYELRIEYANKSFKQYNNYKKLNEAGRKKLLNILTKNL